MGKTLPWIILIALMATLLTISLVHPSFLNDQNALLAKFVNDQLLSILGFIVAVTLASAASVHFELNKLEDDAGTSFTRTRRSLRRSSYSLIILFAFAGLIIVIKPLLPSPRYGDAVANSIAIGIVYFNLSVLLDLTRTVFKIPSSTEAKKMAGAGGSTNLESGQS